MAMASAGGVLGRFVWYELLTGDVEAGIRFYAEVLGWDQTSWPMPGGQAYAGWNVGGQPLAGAFALPEEARKAGAPPHWLAYVGTPDVDDTVERASRRGATVYVPPQDIPEVGRFAVLADPQGAVFAVFTPTTPPADTPPGAGWFSWHELATTDVTGAFEFYGELFEWRQTDAHDMGPMGIYLMFGGGERTLGAMFRKPSEMPGPSRWLLYVAVEDLEGAVEKVKALGGQVLMGPMEVPGGDRIAQCLDPQGAAFALHQLK